MAKHRKLGHRNLLSSSQQALAALRVRQHELDERKARLLRRVIREQRAAAVKKLRSHRLRGAPLLRVLGEGDSWMHYDCGFGVMHYVDAQLGAAAACVNIAGSGATMAGMMKLPARAELDEQLRIGLDDQPWDVLIFSGGGNDLAGDEFANWLLPNTGQTDPAAAVDEQQFGNLLNALADLYRELAELVKRLSPTTRVLLNGYDYAIPDGRGVPFAGPWLAPGFAARGYAKRSLAFRSAVVKLMLQRFASMLDSVSSQYPLMQLVATQGLLMRRDWANELHPTNPGFAKVAAGFVAKLNAL